MLRRVISLAAIIMFATVTGTALAQVAPLPDNNGKLTKEEQDRAAADKAYRDAAKTVPTKSSTDPWGSVRPSAPQSPPPNSSTAAKNKP
jgi:hypothetical protein